MGNYRECVEAGACFPPNVDADNHSRTSCNWFWDDREDHPINCILSAMADSFCAWRGTRTPSHSEYRRALRGNSTQKFPWGDTLPNCSVAHLEPNHGAFSGAAPSSCGGGFGTTRVGSKPAGAGPFGHQDLIGNVSELLSETYEQDWGYEVVTGRLAAGGHYGAPSNYLDPTDSNGLLVGLQDGEWNPGVGVRCASSEAPDEAP